MDLSESSKLAESHLNSLKDIKIEKDRDGEKEGVNERNRWGPKIGLIFKESAGTRWKTAGSQPKKVGPILSVGDESADEL